MELQPSDLVSLGNVVHVGTLKVRDKGSRGNSLEGSGVSFSKHPEAWEKIAKLGGQTWWRADITNLSLLHGHNFIKRHKRELEEWGVQEGWVERCKAYKLSWEDEEQGKVSMLLDTQKEVAEEIEGRDDILVRTVNALSPTAALAKAMGHTRHGVGKVSCQALQDLATVWAQSQGLHGTWWNDRLDPDAYSAPRGMIFAEHLALAGFKADLDHQPRRRGPQP